MRIALALLFMLGWCGPVLAWNEPDGFRDVPFGASEAELMAKLGPNAPTSTSNVVHCRHPGDESIAERACAGWVRIGEIYTEADFYFRAGRFTGLLMLFKSEEFAAMEDVFIELYGPPTKTEDTPVTSRAGVVSVNRRHTWEGPRATVTLMKYGPRLDRSSAVIRWTPDLHESARIRREQAEKAKKDL